MGAARRTVWVITVVSALAVPVALFALNGTVVYAEGTVTVTSGGSSQDAATGTKVSVGDSVTTGDDGLAVIDLSNATQIKLRESTSVVIQAIGSDTRVSLSTGGLFTKVVGKLSGRFSVTTDNAVAGVRGTEFFMAYGKTVDNQRDIWLCVNEGVVDVSIPSANQHVAVPAGQGINIVGGLKLTPPHRYKWTRGLNWNMDAASGAVQDHTSLDQAYSDLLNHDYD